MKHSTPPNIYFSFTVSKRINHYGQLLNALIVVLLCQSHLCYKSEMVYLSRNPNLDKPEPTSKFCHFAQEIVVKCLSFFHSMYPSKSYFLNNSINPAIIPLDICHANLLSNHNNPTAHYKTILLLINSACLITISTAPCAFSGG